MNIQDKMAILLYGPDEDSAQMIVDYRKEHPYVETIICVPEIDPNEPE